MHNDHSPTSAAGTNTPNGQNQSNSNSSPTSTTGTNTPNKQNQSNCSCAKKEQRPKPLQFFDDGQVRSIAEYEIENGCFVLIKKP